VTVVSWRGAASGWHAVTRVDPDSLRDGLGNDLVVHLSDPDDVALDHWNSSDDAQKRASGDQVLGEHVCCFAVVEKGVCCFWLVLLSLERTMGGLFLCLLRLRFGSGEVTVS